MRCFTTALLLCGITLTINVRARAAQGTHEKAATVANQEVQKTLKTTKGTATQREVDQSVPDDPKLAELLAPYRAKLQALDNRIGRLAGDLRKDRIGGGSLGNFVTDAMRAQAALILRQPIQLSITNSGGLRKNTVAAGDLRVRDIYEIMPFENALVKVQLTGEQLLNLLRVIIAKGDAQSGATLTYRTSAEGRSELLSARLNGREINPKATYTLITIDYLVNRGGDYAVLREAKEVQPLGVTLRDAMLDYVRAQAKQGKAIQPTLDNRYQALSGNSRSDDEK